MSYASGSEQVSWPLLLCLSKQGDQHSRVVVLQCTACPLLLAAGVTALQQNQQLLAGARRHNNPSTIDLPYRHDPAAAGLAVHLQERARKELASQVAEENRRIALAKSLERQQQRQAEAEAIRQDMQQVRLDRPLRGAVS